MSRPLWIAFAAVLLLGAGALAAVLVFTDPDRGGPSAAAHPARPQAASRPAPASGPAATAPTIPTPTIPTPTIPVPAPPPGAVVAPPSPQAVQPGQPAPGAVVFETPEDRADALTEMQQQRMKSGMDALNERAARRAAQAPPPAQPRPAGSRSPAP